MAPSDRLCAIRGNHTRGNAELDEEDLALLQPGAWLNAPLVNYKLFLHAASYYGRGYTPSEFTFLPAYVWARWDVAEEPWYRSGTHSNPLLSRFVAMPCLVERCHWVLVVIIYASALLKPHAIVKNAVAQDQPGILIFDSSPSATSSCFKTAMELKLKSLISNIAEGATSATIAERVSTLHVYYPQVPVQPNNFDCGLYCMHYLRIFLLEPAQMAEHCTGRSCFAQSSESIWAAGHLSVLRAQYKEEVEVAQSYEQYALRWASRDIRPPGVIAEAHQSSTRRSPPLPLN